MTALGNFMSKWCNPKSIPNVVSEKELDSVEAEFEIFFPMDYRQQVLAEGLPSPTLALLSAIDDSDVENGCMQAIPGSHTSGIAEHSVSTRDGNLLSINQEIPDDQIDTSRAVNLEQAERWLDAHG